MDSWVSGFATLLTIILLGSITLFVAVSVVVGKLISRKIFKKEDKYRPLKQNLTITAYFCLLAGLMLWSWWGPEIAFRIVLFFSAPVFLLLEALEIIKALLHRLKR